MCPKCSGTGYAHGAGCPRRFGWVRPRFPLFCLSRTGEIYRNDCFVHTHADAFRPSCFINPEP